MTKPLLTDQNSVVFIMGPTAAGKTDAAIYLAEHYDVQIINADAAQVYQQMNIGTAKPTQEELAKAPHKLIDFVDPGASYSASEFRNDALNEIEIAFSQNKTPVLVGGSMFYFKALEFGLSELPEVDPAVREKIEQMAAKLGWEEMHRQLAMIDPELAAKINNTDPQRLQRAFEIYELTGQVPSKIFKAKQAQPMPYRAIKLVIAPYQRSHLHQRIEQRFYQMIERGLIEEVEHLRNQQGITVDLPSMRTVGYRQVWAYLDGDISKQIMLDKAVAATRQLAKRQYTWLRNQSGLVWFVGYNGVDLNALQRYFA